MSEVIVPNEATEVEYLLVGSTTGPFSVPFAFFQEADVNVVSVDSDGVSTVLDQDTDWVFDSFEIPVGQEGIGYQSAILSLVVAATDVTIKVYRNTVIDRVSNFATTGPISIAQLNHELSQSIAIMQELRTNKDKYINLPNDAIDSTPWDGEARALCNLGESESGLCAATNRQADAQGPNYVSDDNAETAVGATDTWQNIFTANGLTIQGQVTDTTKLFDYICQFGCLLQNRNANQASFRIRVRYTVECYAEVTKESNAAYQVEIEGNSAIPFHFIDIEQDIDYFNGLGTLIVAIDIKPNGPNSGNLYCQWSNGLVNTSEPR